MPGSRRHPAPDGDVHSSLLLTRIFESYTGLVEPYSIDEQFLDVTGSLAYFGESPHELAARIQKDVQLSTGVWSRVGIGPTKISPRWRPTTTPRRPTRASSSFLYDKLESTLWELPVHQMFMVASAMTRHFTRMGLSRIGDIARMDFGEFKRRMRREMGKQSDIQAGYYWQTARGIDRAPWSPASGISSSPSATAKPCAGICTAS